MTHHHITQLEKKGLLKRNPNNPSDYQIISDQEKQIAYINVYGMAKCGPSGSLLDGNPIDRMPVSNKILGFPARDAFIVEAKGDSMEPKIHEGDLVVAQKSEIAPDGTLIVCVYNDEVLIKKFKKEDNDMLLVSLNDKYKPIYAIEKSFRIEGIVKSIFSYSI